MIEELYLVFFFFSPNRGYFYSFPSFHSRIALTMSAGFCKMNTLYTSGLSSNKPESVGKFVEN